MKIDLILFWMQLQIGVVYENHNNYSQIFPTVVDVFPFQIKLWPFHPTTQVWSTKLRVKSAGFQHKKINSI